MGVSSKRLCATLNGEPPPSDTESSDDSGSLKFDAVSLENISSDEAGLSADSSGEKQKKVHNWFINKMSINK